MPVDMPVRLELASWVITQLLLVAVGMDLRVADFRSVRERPGMIAAGVLLPPLLLPWVALALVGLLHPSPAAARGLLLLTACPIGGIATTYSMLARANPALSVSLAATSCLTALLTMPLVLTGLDLAGGGWQATPAVTLLHHLAVLLAPPIVVGMGVRAVWPDWAARRQPHVQGLAFVLVVVLLAGLIAGATRSAEFGWRSALLLALAFVVVAFVLGGLSAVLLGGTPADRFTFAAEFGTRNVAIGLAASLAMGMARDFAWLGALYLAVEIPFMLTAALLHRRLQARDS